MRATAQQPLCINMHPHLLRTLHLVQALITLLSPNMALALLNVLHIDVPPHQHSDRTEDPNTRTHK